MQLQTTTPTIRNLRDVVMTVHTFVCGYFTLILNLYPSPGRYLDIFGGFSVRL